MSTGAQYLLIVDDDDTFREVLARSLTRRGFTVAGAATGPAALDACRRTPPHYILLDLNLDGASGLALIQPLLALASEARIVVLTGYASIPTAVGALKLGATNYLPKPASTSEIVRALTEAHWQAPAVDTETKLSVRSMEWEYIQRTLAEHGDNISATARALNMHRRTLQRKLAKKRPAH